MIGLESNPAWEQILSEPFATYRLSVPRGYVILTLAGEGATSVFVPNASKPWRLKPA
jgi:hypothetical protein